MSNTEVEVIAQATTTDVEKVAQTGPVGFADIAAILDVMNVQDAKVTEMQFATLTSAYSGQLVNGDHFSAVIKVTDAGDGHSAAFLGEEPNDFGLLINSKCNDMLNSFMGIDQPSEE